ncbi:MAG TPA: helix-turn-helix transcriptional regulator [Myxococcales bacterium]|nr:helix-turn-helix transcriptional regulator [Myxococcales bacterium]
MADLLPSARYELAGFGELLADPSRTAMLLSLMDGSARPASELAGLAGVTPQTASSHLRRLLEGGLLALERIGRHRYFRLANEGVADAIEAMALLRPPARVRPSTPERLALAEARTCYLHLAGRLGVIWLDTLEKRRFIHLSGDALEMTSKGIAHFTSARMEVPRWPAGKPCLDWTERRSHLGGPLGGLLTKHLFARGWLARQNGSRAVRVTSRGARGFATHFSLRWP